MRKSTKIFIGIILTLGILYGGLRIFEKVYMGGTEYYTQITTSGKQLKEKDDQGHTFYDYRYQQLGFDEEGRQQVLEFNANKSRPLKHQAYLKITFNSSKGVTQWSEVAASEVPKKAKQALANR
ncbi:YxeA family protein [Agrilactobacillus fermenti]|uniref:YxeA family protein n=1 Tax=Agrilactobacillus fermenti TaxID=2586909 RepID=UPI001E395180|nr:YxeA family protein [Agrilactobacillus fermenti]MCD2257370.1 YxeA family protein [Agrilactobacillus fermenti]